jgi:hypothetical protein
MKTSQLYVPRRNSALKPDITVTKKTKEIFPGERKKNNQSKIQICKSKPLVYRAICENPQKQ